MSLAVAMTTTIGVNVLVDLCECDCFVGSGGEVGREEGREGAREKTQARTVQLNIFKYLYFGTGVIQLS